MFYSRYQSRGIGEFFDSVGMDLVLSNSVTGDI